MKQTGQKKIKTFGDFEDLVNKCLDSWGGNTFVGTIRSEEEEILAVLLIKDGEIAHMIEHVISKGFEKIEQEGNRSLTKTKAG